MEGSQFVEDDFEDELPTPVEDENSFIDYEGKTITSDPTAPAQEEAMPSMPTPIGDEEEALLDGDGNSTANWNKMASGEIPGPSTWSMFQNIAPITPETIGGMLGGPAGAALPELTGLAARLGPKSLAALRLMAGSLGGAAGSELGTAAQDPEIYNLEEALPRFMMNTATGGAFGAIPAAGEARRGMLALAESKFPNQAATQLGITSTSRAMTVLRDNFSEAWPTTKSSGILQGGTIFDPVKGIFKAAKGAKKDFYSVYENINTALPKLMEKRDQAIDTVEVLVDKFRKAYPSVLGVGAIDSEKFAKKMVAATDKMAQLGQSDFTGEQAKLFREQLDSVKSSFNNPRPELKGLIGGKVKLSIKDIQTQLDNAYEKLRANGKFDADVQAGVAGGVDPSVLAAKRAETIILSESAKVYRELRDEAIGALYNHGPLANDLRQAGLTKNVVQNYNNQVSSLIHLKDGMEAFTTNATQAQSRAISNTSIDESGKTIFNKKGNWATAFDFMKEQVGMGPSTLGLRSSDRAMKGLQNTATPPKPWVTTGQALALAPAVRSLMGDAEAQGLHSTFSKQGWETEGPSAIPRSLTAIVQNPQALLQAVGENAGPEAAQQIEKLLNSPMPAKAKSEALGKFLSMFPEVQGAFAPSKSGVPSEIDGVIQDMNDRAQIAETIEASDMSIKQKALSWTDLWEKGKYSGKGVYPKPTN